MWPEDGAKTGPCPCCNVCTNCPGFQRVLDIRDAGIVLYRHTTHIEDIDKKTGSIKAATDTIDDVFIIENTQGVPLEKIDFTPEIDRNQISCPRCANIIKHAQRLLQNQDLGARNLIGVCEHCRRKSQVQRTCMKCDKIIKKFQLSKDAEERAERVKSWLSKVQGLIKQTLVEDKSKLRVSKISRTHSDIDINKLLRKPLKSDRELEIEDLFLYSTHQFHGKELQKRPPSEGSYYTGRIKDKGLKIFEQTTRYEDRQNDYLPAYGTSFEEKRQAFVPEKLNEDKNLFQSNMTLTADEVERDFIRRYGKSYKERKRYEFENDYLPASEQKHERVRSKDTTVPYSRREHEQSQELIPTNAREEFTLAGDKTGWQNRNLITPAGEHTYFDDDRDKNNIASSKTREKDQPSVSKSYVSGINNELTKSTKSTRYDSYKKEPITPPDKLQEFEKHKGFVSDVGISQEDGRQKEYLAEADKHDPKFVANLDRGDDDVKRKAIAQTTNKYEYGESKDFIEKADIVPDYKKKEYVLKADKHEIDRNKDLPESDRRSKEVVPTIADKYSEVGITKGAVETEASHSKRTKEFITKSNQYYDSGRKDSFIAETNLGQDDRRRKEPVPIDDKHYENEKKYVPETNIVLADRRRKDFVPIVDKQDEERRKGFISEPDTYDDRRRKDNVLQVGKQYEADRATNILKSDERRREDFVPKAGKHEVGRKKDLLEFEARRKDFIPATSKYYDDDQKDFIPNTSHEEYERKKEFMQKAGIRYETERKEPTPATSKRHAGGIGKVIIPEDEKYYIDDKRKYITPDEGNEGFISRIGKSNEERIKKEMLPTGKIFQGERKKDLMPALKDWFNDERYKEQMAAVGKTYKELKKHFVPLAVRRYTQDVSALLHPIVGVEERLRKKPKNLGKTIYESPSRIRRYRSQEELFSGKVTDEMLDQGFDYYFPQGEVGPRKKTRRAKSETSSAELIKDTMDKLKLKEEEEKRKRDEAERLKQERRKQLEKERQERELAKQIAKDLEKQLKQREKEKEYESKRELSEKQLEDDAVKDAVDKDLEIKVSKEVTLTSKQEGKQTSAVSTPKNAKGREITPKEKIQDIGSAKVKEPKDKKEETKEVKSFENNNKEQNIRTSKAKEKEVPPPESKVKEEKSKVGKTADSKDKEERSKDIKSAETVKKEKRKEIKTLEKIKEEKSKEVKPADKVKEEKSKESKNSDNKMKERKGKENAPKDSDKQKKTAIDEEKKAALDKEKLKRELEAEKLEEEKRNKREQEANEREKLMYELKMRKEEEKRKKLAAEEKAKEEKKAKEEEEKKKKEAEKAKEASNQSKEPKKEINKTEKDASQTEKPKIPDKKLVVTKIIMKKPSIYDLITAKNRPKERKKALEVKPIETKKHKRQGHTKDKSFDVCHSDLELDLQSLLRKRQLDLELGTKEKVVGQKIHKFKSYTGEKKVKEERKLRPIVFEKEFQENFGLVTGDIKVEPEPNSLPEPEPESEMVPKSKPSKGAKDIVDPDYGKGVVRYTLSDRSFIEKGWTMLPTEKVVRKMNVYRMRPAHPEFDWFERNKKKGVLEYDTGEKLAEFDENGRGCLYYRSGKLALDYYNAEEVNAQQRFVIYSSGEPDERGRTHPRTVLATFDYLGNGIVFDHTGKIRLKYNQTEGVVLDRTLGPVSHWKWHTLNDPPVLQQVMIDTQMAHKDPQILKLGGPAENKPRPDDEEMLAIEFDNFIKEKSAKLTQTFKPFQIKMKALKINEYFSLRVLDQATVYLIYRDGSKNIKLNIGMILDHKEIVDTDTAEVGEVSNSLERLPARTDSLAELQRNVANAQRAERSRTERERRIRRPQPSASADQLTAAASRPLHPPLRTADSGSTVAPSGTYCKCRKPTSCNVYYDTSLI